MGIFNFLKKSYNGYSLKHIDSKIIAAVEVFEQSPNEKWPSIHELLKNQLGDSALALDLYRFLPIAYCRMVVGGVDFPDAYIVKDKDGTQTEKKLEVDSLYKAVHQYVIGRFLSDISEKDMMSVLNHSSEFQAINNALNAGSQLENLVLAPPVFT